MANPAKDMILFPSGGMSAEDIGDSQVQKPALPVPGIGSDQDGDLPSIPDVSGFGEGPAVVKPYACTGSPGYEGMPGAA